MEARRRDSHPLHLHDPLLGRIRAGRLHAHAVRGSLHAALGPRLVVSVELVPIGTATFRHRTGACLRMAMDPPRASRAVEPDEILARTATRQPRISRARAGGFHRADAE